MRDRWRTATIALAAVVVVGGMQAAFALRGETVITTKTGKSVTQVKVVRSPSATSINGKTKGYVTVPGARVDITVPAGEHALLLGTFSAETACYSGKGGWCGARMTVDGVEMKPGDDFALDSSDGELSSSWEGHSFQASSNVLGPGTYSVRVQYRVINGSTFEIDDYHFTVMRIAS